MKESKATAASYKTDIIFICIIIALGFIVYGNSLSGKFLYDDNVLVRDNLYIRNASHLFNIFTEDLMSGAGQKSNFYRPLQTISYCVDFFLWKTDPRGYHLTSILLHIMAAGSIYWFVSILFGNKYISLITAMLFVVHPIHTEAISYISGRSDSLSLVFMMLCFISYLKYLRSEDTKLLIMIIAGYVCALLSRESSLILPVLLLLYHFVFKKKINIRAFSIIVAITAIYIILRMTALRFPMYQVAQVTTLSQRLPGFFVAIFNYMRILLLPFNLHMEYGHKIFTFFNPMALAGLIILSVILLAAYWKRTDKLILFSILWFIITLLPVSNIYRINAYMAEHWLYVPSIGVFVIFARAMVSISEKDKKAAILAIVLIMVLTAFYGFLTIGQNNYWSDPIVFYEKTLKYVPDAWRIYLNLGSEYSKINQTGKALQAFKKTIELNPESVDAYNNIANIYQKAGRHEEAVELYKKAIAINPAYYGGYYNLGDEYGRIGNNSEAIVFYKKALELYPNYADAYNNLGILYSGMRKYNEAISSFKKAISINPYHAARKNLGILYKSMGISDDIH